MHRVNMDVERHGLVKVYAPCQQASGQHACDGSQIILHWVNTHVETLMKWPSEVLCKMNQIGLGHM